MILLTFIIELLNYFLSSFLGSFQDINPHTVYELGYYNIENLSIIDIDSKANYKDGFDFRLDKTWGMVEILPKGTIKKGVNIVAGFDVKECIYESMDGGIAFIEHKGKSRDEIIALKKEAESKLNDSYKIHPVGYPYFEDVCYLTKEQLKDFNNETKKTYFKEYKHNTFFMGANYLMYLYLYIQRLRDTQKNVKRIRGIAPPVKEVMSILEYIDNEHEATAPLIRLLSTFEGDYKDEISSYYNRISYMIEKETAQIITPPALNIDKLSELKKEYKAKIKYFYNLMKKHNPRKYKDPTETLLLALNLPTKTTDI